MSSPQNADVREPDDRLKRTDVPATPGAEPGAIGLEGAPELAARAFQRPRQNDAHVAPAAVLSLQRTLGNHAVGRLLSRTMGGARTLQREDDAPAAEDDDGPDTWGEEVEGAYQLSTPEPIAVPPEAVTSPQGPGDYPMPSDPNTLMAMRLPLGSATIQRDDDKAPGLSGDATGGVQTPLHTPPGSPAPAPITFSGTLLFRNLDLRSWERSSGFFRGLDLGHEPGWTWSIDSHGVVQQQIGITLINTHWMPPWGREIELGLSGFLQSTVFPHNPNPLAPGGQLQLEQHVVPWFSVTLSGNSVYDYGSGQMATTGGINLLFHAPRKLPLTPPQTP